MPPKTFESQIQLTLDIWAPNTIKHQDVWFPETFSNIWAQKTFESRLPYFTQWRPINNTRHLISDNLNINNIEYIHMYMTLILILIFVSLHFRRNWTWRLLSCIFGHGEKPPWWKHGSPSLWGYTSGNVWYSCLCFLHLRQSMFLLSNLFKLWNSYIYSCLHIK